MKIKTILQFLISSLILTGCSRLPYAPLKNYHHKNEHYKVADNFMITTQGKASSMAAKRIFDLGGNAIDAAIAASFTISVERPHSTGIGGGGFLLLDGPNLSRPLAFDFRESAPLLSHKDMYLKKNGEVNAQTYRDGALSVATPGLVAGLWEIHQRYGSIPWEQLLAPAIELASKGLIVYPHLSHAISVMEKTLKKYPESKKLFFNPDGSPLKVGQTLIQKDLAETLRIIAKKGKDGFYRGEVANKIVSSQKRHGGLITHQDLIKYRPIERTPVSGNFKEFEIYSMPPPSSGGVHIIQMLNMLESFPLKEWGPTAPHNIHTVAQAMQRAYADRAKYLGDNDFVNVPVNGLTNKRYALNLLKTFSEKHQSSNDIYAGDPAKYESDDTTHFTIADNKGNIISSTQTINGYFGSGIVAKGTGIVLNNEMNDFTAKINTANNFGLMGSDKNLVSPGKRPLSSMSPSIIYNKGQPILALGTPAGSKIINCVLQTILNYIEYDLPLYEAVQLRRFHHQWKPDVLFVGPPYFTKEERKIFESKGYTVKHKELGCKVNAIAIESGKLIGVTDVRGEGLAIGQ